MMESLIQQACLTYLQMLENQGKLYFVRNNSFAGFLQRGNGSVGYIKNQKRGTPDIIVCYQGRFVGLEIKGPKGRQSEFQKEAEAAIRKAGGEYYVIRDTDHLREIIK